MQNAGLVGVSHGGAQFVNPPKLFEQRRGSFPANCFREGLPDDVLHHNVGLRGKLAEVMHRYDVGMVQRSGAASFPDEPLTCVGNIQVAKEQLDCDQPVENRIVRQVDGPHTAAAQPTLHFVPANPISRVDQADTSERQDAALMCAGGVILY
jgi:hypothetical protein